MSEGFTFDPKQAAAEKEAAIKAAKADNKKLNMSLEEIAKSEYEEKKAKREAAKQEKKDQRRTRDERPNKRDNKNNKKDRRNDYVSNKPTQIDVPEGAIRRFLKEQKATYPRGSTLKIMAYPNRK
ncbi:hypothetical protein GPJ56_007151 [Histomonas meleagridis]|uniref:uncharacterized protein n=1 Tax=Histomonas meleagridis TaxID=135588 RepID=UPI0035594F1C|nr:hypothetical protein GPJ56_007151 [Histomonas meleagridis]KAH0806185.1 hypothetical protein GO595_000873 [Histomonas meleagridis]